jgi:hypothetical protein
LTYTWASNGKKQVSTEPLIRIVLQQSSLNSAVCYFYILSTLTTLQLIKQTRTKESTELHDEEASVYRITSYRVETSKFKVGRPSPVSDRVPPTSQGKRLPYRRTAPAVLFCFDTRHVVRNGWKQQLFYLTTLSQFTGLSYCVEYQYERQV